MNRKQRKQRNTAPRGPVHVVTRWEGRRPMGHTRKLRRYEATIPMALPAAPGARWRRHLPAVQLGQREKMGLLMLFLALVFGLVYYLPAFRLNTIELQGAERLPAAEVVATLGVQGRPIWMVQPARLEQALLQAFPELRAVQVTRSFWPAGLHVQLTEREPVAAVRQDGRFFLVDADGVLFLPRQTVDDLPVLTAFSPLVTTQQTALSPDLVAAVQRLGLAAPADARLIYDGQYGLGWQAASGERVFFGQQPQQLEVQLRLYAALQAALQERGVQPTLIDLGNLHAPYFRTGY